jgi:DNA-binding CsgD family transcriptional regulator
MASEQGGKDPNRTSDGLAVSMVPLGDVKLVLIALPTEARIAGLTPAEGEVARLAGEGFSNREIAALRGSAERTVANQLRRIYRKLGIASRFELAARLSRSDPTPSAGDEAPAG